MEEVLKLPVHPAPSKLTFSWTSDGDGDATVQTSQKVSGRLIAVTTIPSGAAAPSDNYDVTLVDEDGHDVALGALADRDTANTEHVTEASIGAIANSKITCTVANAGDTKSGTVIVWLQ